MPNYANAGHGPRDIDKDAAKARQDLHHKARTTLILHHLATPNCKFFEPKLKPHTRIWHDVGRDKVEPLGVVFHRWEDKYAGITFTQRAADRSVVRQATGQFALDRNGEEMGLVVKDRWIWEDLLRRHQGLSYGNM